MHALFAGLPIELAGAAEIDGCNEFYLFFSSNLPLARPAVST
jgi:ABC-type glycerol-3-phosphate transport system permease component